MTTPYWREVSDRLAAIATDSNMIHRIVIEWDDRKDVQTYTYKAYDKDRNLVVSGPVSAMVPLHHGADDKTLVSALIWVGFGLETAVHRSECIVERPDNMQSSYSVWDRSYKQRRVNP